MKVLITGGAGFIGSHLTELLLSQGDQVNIIDDLSTGSLDNISGFINNANYAYTIDSVLNEMVIDRLVSECDVVFHLAAAVGVELIVKSPAHTIRTNVEGSSSVLAACLRYRKRVLIASTSEVYGKSTDIPFCEESDTVSGPTIKQRWSYACSKAIDEFMAFAMLKEHDLPVHVVRLFNTVGPGQSGQYGMVVPRFIGQALAGDDITVYGDGEQSRCFANVHDVSWALAKLVSCEESVGKVVNLGTDEEISINGLAERIVERLQSKSKIVHIPYSEAYEVGFEDMQRRVPSLKRAAELIKYAPQIKLDQTIDEVAAHINAVNANN